MGQGGEKEVLVLCEDTPQVLSNSVRDTRNKVDYREASLLKTNVVAFGGECKHGH